MFADDTLVSTAAAKIEHEDAALLKHGSHYLDRCHFVMLPIQEKIVFADDMLVSNAVAKILDEDVLMTYAASSVVYDILVAAHKVGWQQK
jgi:translation initiation factor 2B subunit (eIF-2B alpha/beta/delta family)